MWHLRLFSCITLMACVPGRRHLDRGGMLGLGTGSTVRVELQEPSEVHASQESAMSLAEAEVAFMNWRSQFVQQPCSACTKHEATPQETSNSQATSQESSSFFQAISENRDAANRTGGAPTRLAKAIFAAMTPQAALATCLTLNINLLSLGIPATLTLSFRGEVAYGVCNRCFQWGIEADMAYKVGIDVLGYGFQVGFNVKGGVKLRELPCTDAPESSYCRFLHVFLPPEVKKLSASSNRCHSESPFEALIAFIDFQWRKLRATAKGEKEVFVNDFDRKLHTYAQQLKAYPALFSGMRVVSVPAGRSKSASMLRKQTGSREFSRQKNASRHRSMSASRGSPNARGLPARPRKMNRKSTSMLQTNREHVLAGKPADSNIASKQKRRARPRASSVSKSSANARGSPAKGSRGSRGSPSTSRKSSRDKADAGRILLATCVRGEELPSMDHFSKNDAYCQLEVSLAEATTDENYQRVYGGVGPRAENECESLNATAKVCKNLDRCFWKPSFSKGRLCTLAPKFMGEVWRSSFIPDTDIPRWDEGHGFRLPLGSNDVILYGAVFDWDDEQAPDKVGEGLQRRITVKAGNAPIIVKLPLRKRLNQNEKAGFLFVSLQWLAPEGDGSPTGKLIGPLGAMSAAAESFVGKLPDYAVHIGMRLEYSNDWDAGINYKSLSGRYMARWLRAEVREDLEEKETSDVSVADYVKDPNAPEDNAGCKYSSASKQCEPALYCKGERFFFSTNCKLKDFVKANCSLGSRKQQKTCHASLARKKIRGNFSEAQAGSPMWNYLRRRVSEADAKLHRLPCSTLSITSDERVVNFARALTETHPKAREDQYKFYAEFVTSVANLFIRTIQDVQAMFNIYFANDPNWDDDCLSLEPVFQNFYEFSTNGMKRRLRTQEKPSMEWLTHRVKVRGTVESKGKPVQDTKNPWCRHSWASGDRHPSQRLQFAHPDPPTGLAGHQTPPRKLNGSMMPHLWCELAHGLRASPEGKARPYGAVKYHRGKSLSFKAACSQLAFFEVVDSNGDLDGEFKFWRRYDCEQVVLGSAFLTFFPTFVQKVEVAQKKIGEILEDALQCAGRIDDDGREFPSASDSLYRLCPVSVDDMLARKKESPDLKRERSKLLAAKARTAIGLLKEWLNELSDSGPVFLKDFTETWEFGERLTGLIYKAGQGIQNAYEALGSRGAIAERIESLEEHLVQKAWRVRGQSDKALFPPPVSYETTIEVGVSATFGETRDICKIEAVPRLELVGRYMRSGVTYIPTALDLEKYCMVGTFAPVPSVEISIRGCRRTVEIDEVEQQEISWSIGLRGILAVHDMLPNMTNMKTAFTRNISQLNTDQMKRDRLTASVPWVMMKNILSNPTAFLSGSLGSAANVMRPVVMDVGKKLGLDAASAKATELGQQLTSSVKKKLLSKFQGFELKSYRIIDAQLHFVRLGDGPYEPKFSVHYKHMMSAKVSFAFPGAVSGNANIHLSQRYDLSEVFSVVYHIVKGSRETKVFEKCVQCLDKHHTTFCYNSGTGASRCLKKAGHRTCKSANEEAVVDVTDCGLADSDDQT